MTGSGSSGSGSGSSFFAFVALVALVFFAGAFLVRPPAFLRPFAVAVEAVDIMEATDVVLWSTGSSKSTVAGSNSSGSGAGSSTGSASSSTCMLTLAFFVRVALVLPVAFRFVLLVVEALDMFDASDVVLVSIESSRSGIS